MDMREFKFQLRLSPSQPRSFSFTSLSPQLVFPVRQAYRKSSQKCGIKLHDDYIELQTGAVQRLEQLLEKYFSSTSEPDEAVDPDAISAAQGTGGIDSWGVKLRSKFWLRNDKASTLPHHHASKRSAEELGTCPVMPETPHMDHNFVLLCVPFVRLVSKLWQAEICRINSDRDFFRVLRHHYNNRAKRPWARLRKVKAVNFVKVSMEIAMTQVSFCVVFLPPRHILILLLVRDVPQPACGHSKVP